MSDRIMYRERGMERKERKRGCGRESECERGKRVREKESKRGESVREGGREKKGERERKKEQEREGRGKRTTGRREEEKSDPGGVTSPASSTGSH